MNVTAKWLSSWLLFVSFLFQSYYQQDQSNYDYNYDYNYTEEASLRIATLSCDPSLQASGDCAGAQPVSTDVLRLSDANSDSSQQSPRRIHTTGCDPTRQASGDCAGVNVAFSTQDTQAPVTSPNTQAPSGQQDSPSQIISEQECMDISPTEQFDCEWYRERGACGGLEEQYCQFSCKNCCLDKEFPGLGCEYVKENLCEDAQVIEQKYYQRSCGVCAVPLSSLPEAEIIRKFFEYSVDAERVQSLGGDNACIWGQVRCNDEGKAQALYFDDFLGSFAVSGNTIPPEVSLLKSLEELHLRNNELMGTIPPAKLTSLIEIDLMVARISGTLPKELSVLTLLFEFLLWDNQLTGTLPVEYSVLAKNGFGLFLDENKFSGQVPVEYSVFYEGNFDVFPQNGSLCVDGNAPEQLLSSFGDGFDEPHFC